MKLLALSLLAIPTISHAAWEYKTVRDEMRGTEVRVALLRSTNSVQLEFPYAGGSQLDLVLRQKSGIADAYLVIEKGQLACLSPSCKISARFDEGDVIELVGEPGQNTSTVFLEHPQLISETIRLAKKLIVEVSLHNDGARQFKFDLDGLEWPWPSATPSIHQGLGEQKWAAAPLPSMSTPTQAKASNAVCYEGPIPDDPKWKAANVLQVNYCFVDSKLWYAVANSQASPSGIAALRKLALSLMGRKPDSAIPGYESWRGDTQGNLFGAALMGSPEKKSSAPWSLLIRYEPVGSLAKKNTN